MRCLLKYQWVKLPRTNLPQGKGIMAYWARLASRAAFRKGLIKETMDAVKALGFSAMAITRAARRLEGRER